jgi:hypothetical protein
MEPINGLPPTGPVTAAGARVATRGRGFKVEGEAAAHAAEPGDTEAVAETSLAGLLAMQEALDGGPARDRAARRRGLDLLAELAALQRDLLDGDPGAARLARLAGLAAGVPDAADPRLREAVAAIALRARVEAARYGGG